MELPFLGEYLDTFTITPQMVLVKLRELNPAKTPGPDGWHPYFLENIADIVSIPLSDIFQKSPRRRFCTITMVKSLYNSHT